MIPLFACLAVGLLCLHLLLPRRPCPKKVLPAPLDGNRPTLVRPADFTP